MKNKSFISNSESETEKIAENFAKSIEKPSVIAMSGEMGSGKTAFVRGFMQGMESEDYVSSPTFSLVNKYTSKKIDVFHFDLYRISSHDELYTIGFYDYLELDSILVIEWADDFVEILPENTIFIDLKKLSENSREIYIHQNL